MAPPALFVAIPVDVLDAQPVYIVNVNDERVVLFVGTSSTSK